jgi:hypothetical protein
VNARLLLAVRIVAALAMAATLALMAWAASWSWSGLGFLLGLAVWCVLPYAPFLAAARKPRVSRTGCSVLLAMVVLVAAFAAFVYVDAFFVHLDAQGALVLLFVPAWQWAGTLAGLVVASQLEFRARRAAGPVP